MTENLLLEEMISLLTQLENPPRSIFSDFSGDPCCPDGEAAAQASSFELSVSSKLSRLIQIVADLDDSLLDLAELVASSELEPPLSPPTGSLCIEELPRHDDGGGTAATEKKSPTIQIVQVVALYGGDAALNRPWAATSSVSAVAAGLLEALVAKRGPACISSSPSLLLVDALPLLLDSLRPVITAHAEHVRTETSRLEPYAGPDAWHRAVAASQVAWVTKRIPIEEIASGKGNTLQLLYHVLYTASLDPSPAVQESGLRGLQHIAAAVPLQWTSEAIETTAKRAVVGCDSRVWPAAAAFAVHIASIAEGGLAYGSPAALIFEVLLDEGIQHAHESDRSIVWLETVPCEKLFISVFGLQLTRYFSRLMPLLLEWCISTRKGVRLGALRAVQCAVRATWPRIPAHAAVLWDILERVHEDEVQFAGKTSEEILAAVQQAADAVWHCGGKPLQEKILKKHQEKMGLKDNTIASKDGNSRFLLDTVLSLHA